MTNDGATILKAIGVDNPAAKVLVGKCIHALKLTTLVFIAKNDNSVYYLIKCIIHCYY